MRLSCQIAGVLAGLRSVSADFSEAVGFRLLVQFSLSPWSDGLSGRLVQSSEVLSSSPLLVAGCGGYPSVGSALLASSRLS